MNCLIVVIVALMYEKGQPLSLACGGAATRLKEETERTRCSACGFRHTGALNSWLEREIA